MTDYFVIDLLVFVVSALLGAGGAWVISKWGKKISILDTPNERSSHKHIVPKGGAVGIFTAFVLASFILPLPKLFSVAVGVISLLSFYGDKKEISPRLRLAVQFSAAVIMMVGIFQWQGTGSISYLFALLFCIFVVGTANYYNFMDGINGIASITGIVGFGLIAFFAGLSDAENSIPKLAVCLSMACLGFLPFNIPRARVFMGDVGSILLGFVFAGTVVWLSRSLHDFIILCSFLFPFYADELITSYIRIRDGENLLKPHRRHFYQILANEKGMDHWKISAAYGVLQLFTGVIMLMLKPYGILTAMVFLTVCFTGAVWINLQVRTSVKHGELRDRVQFWKI